MRNLLILGAALAGLSTAVSAQDRTPPTGALDGYRQAAGQGRYPAYAGPAYGEPDYTGSIPRRR